MKTRLLTVLSTLTATAALGATLALAPASPAAADTRWATANTGVPHVNHLFPPITEFPAPSYGILCSAKARSFGWGSSSIYELVSRVQRKPRGGVYKDVPSVYSQAGDLHARSSAQIAYHSGRYRCGARLRIINSKGAVLKSYGWTYSPGADL